MRKTVSFAWLALSTLALASCGGGSSTPTPTPTPVPTPTPTPSTACPRGTTDAGPLTSNRGTKLQVCNINGVSTNTTLPYISGVVYHLVNTIIVGTDVGADGTAAGGNGVTLTIEPGVVITADEAGKLIVNRGSKISAIGTSARPIIFTSSENMLRTVDLFVKQYWGGIYIAGRAQINKCDDKTAAGGSSGCEHLGQEKYGGATATDSSGTMQYVQIRFGVLSLQGVGSGTTVDHVQAADGGITVDGGRVNLSSLALQGEAGSRLLFDQGYRGTTQYVVSVASPESPGNTSLEGDGLPSEGLPRTYARISNATLVARSSKNLSWDTLQTNYVNAAILNSVVVSGDVCLSARYYSDPTSPGQDLGPPIFRSVVMSCTQKFRQGSDATYFGSGTNNNDAAFTSTLANFINGANENAVPWVDPTPFNADMYAVVNPAAPNQLSMTTYIGAVQNAADTRFQGWTCNSWYGYVTYGTGQTCEEPPL